MLQHASVARTDNIPQKHESRKHIEAFTSLSTLFSVPPFVWLLGDTACEKAGLQLPRHLKADFRGRCTQRSRFDRNLHIKVGFEHESALPHTKQHSRIRKNPGIVSWESEQSLQTCGSTQQSVLYNLPHSSTSFTENS